MNISKLQNKYRLKAKNTEMMIPTIVSYDLPYIFSLQSH